MFSTGECFGNSIQARSDHRFAASECLAHDESEGFRGNLSMNEAVQSIHPPRHIEALTGEEGFPRQAKLHGFLAEVLLHVPSADDQKPRVGHLLVNLCCSLKKFALPFAVRQIESAHHTKSEIPLGESPLASEPVIRSRATPLRIDRAVDT